MSDLSEIHEKINAIALGQAKTNGMLEATLPKLATKDQVSIMVTEHKTACKEERRKSDDHYKRPSMMPMGSKKKNISIGISSAGIGVLITWLIEHFFI